MATLQSGQKKKELMIQDFSVLASFLMECFFFSSLMELPFLPQFLILLTDPQSLQRLFLET